MPLCDCAPNGRVLGAANSWESIRGHMCSPLAARAVPVQRHHQLGDVIIKGVPIFQCCNNASAGVETIMLTFSPEQEKVWLLSGVRQMSALLYRKGRVQLDL
jgi:hypothetical protein